MCGGRYKYMDLEADLEQTSESLSTAERQLVESRAAINSARREAAASATAVQDHETRALEQEEAAAGMGRESTLLQHELTAVRGQLDETGLLVKSQRQTIEMLQSSVELAQQDRGSFGGSCDLGGLAGDIGGSLAAETQAADLRDQISALSAALLGSQQVMIQSVKDAVQQQNTMSPPPMIQMIQQAAIEPPMGSMPAASQQRWGSGGGSGELGLHELDGCSRIAECAGVLMAAIREAADKLSETEGPLADALGSAATQLMGSADGLVQRRVRELLSEQQIANAKQQLYTSEHSRVERQLRDAKAETQGRVQAAQKVCLPASECSSEELSGSEWSSDAVLTDCRCRSGVGA